MIGHLICAVRRLFGQGHKERRVMGYGYNRECRYCGAKRQTRARKVDTKTAPLFPPQPQE